MNRFTDSHGNPRNSHAKLLLFTKNKNASIYTVVTFIRSFTRARGGSPRSDRPAREPRRRTRHASLRTAYNKYTHITRAKTLRIRALIQSVHRTRFVVALCTICSDRGDHILLQSRAFYSLLGYNSSLNESSSSPPAPGGGTPPCPWYNLAMIGWTTSSTAFFCFL